MFLKFPLPGLPGEVLVNVAHITRIEVLPFDPEAAGEWTGLFGPAENGEDAERYYRVHVVGLDEPLPVKADDSPAATHLAKIHREAVG